MAEDAILLQRGAPSWERQMAACIKVGYEVVGTVHSHEDAVALVYDGLAKVVVAATAAKDDWRLERLLNDAGGRLEICREMHARLVEGPGHDTVEIVTQMHRGGGTTGEILRLTRLLGVAEERVRAILDRIRRKP